MAPEDKKPRPLEAPTGRTFIPFHWEMEQIVLVLLREIRSGLRGEVGLSTRTTRLHLSVGKGTAYRTAYKPDSRRPLAHDPFQNCSPTVHIDTHDCKLLPPFGKRVLCRRAGRTKEKHQRSHSMLAKRRTATAHEPTSLCRLSRDIKQDSVPVNRELEKAGKCALRLASVDANIIHIPVCCTGLMTAPITLGSFMPLK